MSEHNIFIIKKAIDILESMPYLPRRDEQAKLFRRSVNDYDDPYFYRNMFYSHPVKETEASLAESIVLAHYQKPTRPVEPTAEVEAPLFCELQALTPAPASDNATVNARLAQLESAIDDATTEAAREMLGEIIDLRNLLQLDGDDGRGPTDEEWQEAHEMNRALDEINRLVDNRYDGRVMLKGGHL